LQAKTQNEIQTQITYSTVNLLAPCIGDLRQALIEIVVRMNQNAEARFYEFEQDIHKQIKQLLSFEIDHALVEQLQHTNAQLKPLL
ncbi:hypothetical protein BU068_12750, partial [Staphylococcus succinus]